MVAALLKGCIFLLSFILSVVAKRNFLIKITNFECQAKSSIVNLTCTQTKSRRVSGFNVLIRFTEDVYEMRYDLEVLFLNKRGHWEKFFKFINLDVCEFLSAKFPVPILVIARNIMRKFSNLEDCPIRKDVNYYIQGMKLDPELFPPYLPEGQFSANGSIYNRDHVFLNYAIGIQTVSKKNLKFEIKRRNDKS